jgi:uncharacterized damage-inducible protein DinB
MADLRDPKTVLHHYLRQARDSLIWKLEGVRERDARFPRTPTGTNLLGVVKHCLNVEALYFGTTFGRAFDEPQLLLPMTAFDDDPQADWYATEKETKDGLVELYRRVAAFADETIEELPLDTVGTVPWWRPGRQEVTLQRVIVHVTCDLARHAGHADIMREQIDGKVGWDRQNSNIPQGYDWPAYVARLVRLADRSAGPSAEAGSQAE